MKFREGRKCVCGDRIDILGRKIISRFLVEVFVVFVFCEFVSRYGDVRLVLR